jgi:DNA invertase Pin-like site-specific DNA recombinase
VLCWKWDRFIREPLDLEYLIPRFDKAGVRFAEADGIIDLGTDSGRLAARILVAVAKAEQERKAERQKLANEAAAVAGKRRLGTPRPFGYRDDHVTRDPAEALAVEEACTVLLGGGTLSGIMREWTDAGVRPAQSKTGRWTRQSIRTILPNPRIAGLSVYRGEIVGKGEWESLVAEETWRAVRGILDDPARKPPRGVRTLLGGLALRPCGNVVGWRSWTSLSGPWPGGAIGAISKDAAHPVPTPRRGLRWASGMRPTGKGLWPRSLPPVQDEEELGGRPAGKPAEEAEPRRQRDAPAL